VPGGVYVECGLSAGGIDISKFMADPVPPFDMATHRGQDYRKRGGTWHLFDWVGEAHYPTAADVFEETARFGASRRASPNDEFGKLSSKSRLILVHPRAYPKNPERPYEIEGRLGLREIPAYRQRCMNYRASGGEDETHFDHAEVPCTRYWWLDAGWARPVNRSTPLVEAGSAEGLPHLEDTEGEGAVRQGTRSIGDAEYTCHGGPKESPTGPLDLEMGAGICFSLPITAIGVVTSAGGEHQERSRKIMGKCSIPVVIQDS
jgi:hypothetical protein